MKEWIEKILANAIKRKYFELDNYRETHSLITETIWRLHLIFYKTNEKV